jgi:hypothetical protein
VAYRLPSERVLVTAGDVSAEVERVSAWPIAHSGALLIRSFYVAKPGAEELDALRNIYGYFVLEAQPTWDIEDHRGRIPATPAGMLRLPVDAALGLVSEWLGTLIPTPTVADEVLPPGPVRDEVNTALRKARRKARPDAE